VEPGARVRAGSNRRVREIATDLGVDDSTVYRWIANGKLPAHRFGDSIRVDPEKLEEFKRQRERET
jgi:excisionase family DNA binding protein